jgi:hypothetical protein
MIPRDVAEIGKMVQSIATGKEMRLLLPFGTTYTMRDVARIEA